MHYLIPKDVLSSCLALNEKSPDLPYQLAMESVSIEHSLDEMVVVESKTMPAIFEKAQKIVHSFAERRSAISSKLTRREIEVLDGVVRCLSNKGIASGLNISERTVKFHVSSLLLKFGVKSRMELGKKAKSDKWIMAQLMERREIDYGPVLLRTSEVRAR